MPNAAASWIPLTSVEQMAQTEYDVLIVGSGAGGGAALMRICERWGSGKRIGMIEAGDLLLPTHGMNLPAFDQNRFTKFINNTRYAEPVGKLWPYYSGARIFRALGGRTLHWYLMSPRLLPEDFRTWPLVYNELDPYYLAAERIMNVTGSYAEGSSLQEIFLERLRFNGFPDATGLPLAADREPTRYGQVHSNVFFSSIIFLAYALNYRPFDLTVNTRVVQVLTEGGKAVGVKAVTKEKKTCIIRARTVILSASTFETPRILLNSNIQGEGIGRYLVNHSTVVANAKVKRSLFPEVLGNVAIMVPGSAERRHMLEIVGTDPLDFFWYHYKEKPVLDELRIRYYGLGTVEPRFENRISLDPTRRDEYGVPLLNVQFSYSNRDKTVIREMFHAVKGAAAVMGLEFYDPPCLIPPGADNHEAGTCRMGDDPLTSATNRYGNIHGVSGLYVADNSVVPLTGAANPTLTTVALAIRTADHIIEQTDR